jgi:L-ectoine synthase
MFIRSVREILGTERDVVGEGWTSRRLILARDGLPYSLHETVAAAHTTLRFAYRGHRETVYGICGAGTIANLATGEVRPLEPGTLYTAGIGEDHRVSTQSKMKFLCVFDPPLAGREEAD